MKTTLLACGMLLFVGCNSPKKSNEIEVPATVMETFSKQFPSATNVKWSMESENEYEAEYDNGTDKQASNYDATGKWIVTETEISQNNLPDSVQVTLAREFEGYSVLKAEKAETSDKGTFYEVQLSKGETKYSADLTPEGKILKKEEKKENGEEEEDEDEEDED